MIERTFTLTGATLTTDVSAFYLPFSITLNSSAVGRKIELSTNGGVEYFSPVLNVTSPTMLVTDVAAPITHIKVTGAINDTLLVVG